MTKEAEYNAHVRCSWCHSVRPVKETINWDSHTICRDGDCLQRMKGHASASYLSGYAPAVRRSGNSD